MIMSIFYFLKLKCSSGNKDNEVLHQERVSYTEVSAHFHCQLSPLSQYSKDFLIFSLALPITESAVRWEEYRKQKNSLSLA